MTRARRRLTLPLAVWAAVSFAAPFAHAGPDEEAKSRNLFKQAESLANDGRWKEACHLYQAAHDLNSTGGTALRAADCYEKIADYEHALAMYRYVVDHRAKDKLAERVKLAEGRVFALEKQLAKDSPRQGPVQQAPVQQAPLVPSNTQPVHNRVPAIVLLGIGGAGAVAGGVLGVLALAQAGDVKSACGGSPPCKAANRAELESRASAATAKAWGANIAIGVAVVGVATGAILFALKIPKASAAVKSAVGPQGITLRF